MGFWGWDSAGARWGPEAARAGELSASGFAFLSAHCSFLALKWYGEDFRAPQIKQIHIYSLPSCPHVQASQILIWELLERQIYL
jgi:hypothetical protein